jgi:hypothetical protein
MLVVVSGITYVTGALLGGLLAGVGFSLFVATFNALSNKHASLHGTFSTLAHVAAVAPALIGIGLGRSPSGSVHDIVESYRAMRDAKGVLVGGAVTEAALYLLALGGILTNWWFAILTVMVILLLPVVGQMVKPEAFFGEEEVARRRGEVPLELMGIDAPYTRQLRDEIDRALGMEVTPELAASILESADAPS